MSTAIHFDAQYGLSDALLLSFLLTGLSSAPVGFVLMMWFDLLP
ncbi:putative membrane protein [Synechococcus sp. MIT S9220]|nr:putative membrane protein [Synechococcus sp. MIT S9220]